MRSIVFCKPFHLNIKLRFVSKSLDFIRKCRRVKIFCRSLRDTCEIGRALGFRVETSGQKKEMNDICEEIIEFDFSQLKTGQNREN